MYTICDPNINFQKQQFQLEIQMYRRGSSQFCLNHRKSETNIVNVSAQLINNNHSQVHMFKKIIKIGSGVARITNNL